MQIEALFQPTTHKRILFFILFDVLISISTIVMSYLLRFNFQIPTHFFDSMMIMMMVLIPLKVMVFFLFKIYFTAWRYFGLVEYKRLVTAHIALYLIFIAIFNLFYDYFAPFPRSVILIDLFLSLFFIGLLRISRRIYLESKHSKESIETLIYGANEQATLLIKSLNNQETSYKPLALISSSQDLVGTYFSNLKVYATESLREVIQKYNIRVVIISESLEQKQLDKLFTDLKALGIEEIKIAQIFQEERASFKDISIEDLLARKPKDLDRISIANFIVGKKVMITGAGGSIGSELSRQVADFGASEIILLDHSEYNLYQISEELKDANIISIMRSVKDIDALEEVFKRYQPEVVIHAAAYKHVPLCEENIQSAIENNIFGSKNVIDLSVKYDVKKLVLISTDKAVRPTNVMGTTKRICELYAHAVPSKETEIVAVRFGNVLGSSGSVIPKFKAQIEKGEDITVTHPEITRYFMMIPEACQLVLQAASIAKGGELFILDMGEPIKIVDLAKKMIELSGREDIKIQFTGLRAGEKLYEELLIEDTDLKTEYSSIMVSQNPPVDYNELVRKMKLLKSGKEQELLSVLQEIVPEFDHQLNQ